MIQGGRAAFSGLALSLMLFGACSSSAAVTEPTGQLVLRDDDGNIVVSQPDGSNQTILSEPGDDHTQPTWSNAGDKVAWSSFGPDGPALNIARADGTEVAQIPALAPAFYLSWSPDDSWLAGLRPSPTGMEMFIANPNTEQDRAVSNAQPFYFEWKNDDEIVAAAGNRVLLDITTTEDDQPTDRSPSSPLGLFQAPAVLPDGDVLVTVLDNDTNELIRLDNDDVTPLASADAPILISASPDGSRAALVVPTSDAQQAQTTEIAFQFEELIQLEPGRVTVIDFESGLADTLDQRGVVAVSWSPDSSALAVLGSSPGGFGLQWSFETESGIVLGDTFTPSERFTQRYLPFFDQYNLSSTWWSPDSSAIVFSGETANEVGIFVDRVFDDAPARKVADGDIAFWSPTG